MPSTAHHCTVLGLFPCFHQVRLRQKLSDATGAVKSFFTGQAAEKDPAVVKLEELKVWGKGCGESVK